MQNQRIKRELEKISKSPPSGIFVQPKNDNLRNLEATILGPPSTPYEKGTFHLEVNVPQNYPFSPPAIKFITKIYHPNIDSQGRICLNLLKLPPVGSWNPTMTIEGLLIAVRMLIENPNPDDPLMTDISNEFVNNKKDFERKAAEYVEKHAQVLSTN